MNVKRKMGVQKKVVLVAFIFLLAVPVMADDAKAKELFAEGTRLYEAGEYRKAADTFREANQVNPNWKLLFNIGQCEALAKRHGLALQAFEAYLSNGGDDVNVVRIGELRNEIKRLREMTGFVEIRAPKGAMIHMDDVARGTAPIVGKIPVAASVPHIVVVSPDGIASETQTVMVTGGQKAVVDFMPEVEIAVPVEKKLRAEENARQKTPILVSPAPSSLSSVGKWGILSLSIGGGFLIAGGITGIVTASKFDTLEKRCPQNQCDGESDKAISEQVDTLSLTTDIFLSVSAAFVLTGIILTVVDKKRRSSESVNRTKTDLWVLPTTGGVMMQGMF